ncbi:MAG TPA: oligoendopeptidase F, partial [Clostridium sp.]|nr:oligoendopeptidase F [Clostridium sp.]
MSEVKKLKIREEVPEKYKWNVEKMYLDEKAWESDFIKAKEIAPKLLDYKGKLKDPNMLLGYLESYVKVSNLVEDLYVYAHLRSDENTANTKYQVLLDRIRAYLTEVNSITSFFVPEILTLSEEDINKAIDELEPLRLYEKYLKDILEQKPHILSEEGEKLLASAENSLSAPGNIFNMLTNADMTFPVIQDENNYSIELTEGNYSVFIRSKNRKVRQEAFNGLFG